MSEPTSVLTFGDLLAETAYYLGIHDTDGGGNYVAPADTTDLMLCKQIVNKAVRMFVHDAPQSGWRWTRSLASVVIWPSIAVAAFATGKVSGGAFSGGLTTLTASVAAFSMSTVGSTISVTGVGTFKVNSYISATQVVVTGDAHTALDATFLFGATVSGGAFSGGLTTLTATTALFYQSMELKNIVVTGVGTFKVNSYISATQVVVTGDASAAVARTFSVTADGNYTLPDVFGGQVTGDPIYVAGTNRGILPVWTDESVIRAHRSNVDLTTGTPYEFAYRVMDTLATGSARRRWELLAWWTPGDILTVQFPYLILFDKFVNTTDVSPAPMAHDETIKAACIATIEKDVEKVIDGTGMAYYQKALSNSYRVDGLSAPRTLGYFGNRGMGRGLTPISRDWRYNVPGITVGFNQ